MLSIYLNSKFHYPEEQFIFIRDKNFYSFCITQLQVFFFFCNFLTVKLSSSKNQKNKKSCSLSIQVSLFLSFLIAADCSPPKELYQKILSSVNLFRKSLLLTRSSERKKENFMLLKFKYLSYIYQCFERLKKC